MSDCLSAGTGCGWCIPILKMIHARSGGGFEVQDNEHMPGLPSTAVEYEAARKDYLKSDRKNTFDK